VHLRACQAERPDPVELGYDLAALLLRDSWGFAPDLAEYADLLSDVGMATVRKRISAAYAENPDSFQAQHLMDIEYVASRYAAAERADDVLTLRRARFQAQRTLPNYRALRQAATDCGVWEPAERADAVRRLRADAAATKVSQWVGPVLVDALVDDGELDAAWTAAADGANQAQRLRLADASAGYRPADALAVYLKAVEALTDQTGNDVYPGSLRSCFPRGPATKRWEPWKSSGSTWRCCA
jgi:hypothetical protein